MNKEIRLFQFIPVRKYIPVILSVLCLLNFAVTSSAQTLKTITLKDGSLLKGIVIQLNNGIYTLETANLGRIEVPESDILSITSSTDQTQNQGMDVPDNAQSAILKDQVQALQGSILSDPGLMTEIQDLLNDEAVQTMLTDPKLLDDLLTYDPEKIQANENVQGLLQNPKMQNLMQMIQQKIPAEE